MKRKIMAYGAAELVVDFACGHTARLEGSAVELFDLMVKPGTEANCFECDLIADPARVRVPVGYHLVCFCLRAMQGFPRDGTCYAYALKDCPNCGGDGIQP